MLFSPPTPSPKKSILEKILITILQSGCLPRKRGMPFVFPVLFLTLQTIKYEFYLRKVLSSKSSEIRRVFGTQSFGSNASPVASRGQSARQTFPTRMFCHRGNWAGAPVRVLHDRSGHRRCCQLFFIMKQQASVELDLLKAGKQLA